MKIGRNFNPVENGFVGVRVSILAQPKGRAQLGVRHALAPGDGLAVSILAQPKCRAQLEGGGGGQGEGGVSILAQPKGRAQPRAQR